MYAIWLPLLTIVRSDKPNSVFHAHACYAATIQMAHFVRKC
jgi:hypothetical protein